MCTSPLSIVRKGPHVSLDRTDIVPCGKCPECLLRKQAEFACLATLQAKKAASVDFLTFTYRPDALPIMKSDAYPVDHLEFVDTPEARWAVSAPNREAVCASDGVFNYCPSLRRDDIKTAFKAARYAYKVKYGKLPSFTYAGFGEYG